MAQDVIQSSFQRSVMSLAILSLLDREEMYGYQMVQEIAHISSGHIVTQEGSLYPVLCKLLEQGMISDRKVLVGKRMTRVYYHIEPAGREYLQKLIEGYEAITQGIFQIIQWRNEYESH